MDFEKLLQTFKDLPVPRKLMLAGVAVIVLVSLSTFVYVTNKEEYRVLFSNLAGEDAASIVTALKDQKIPYQLSSSGDTISVPASRVSELRLEMAAAGHLHGGSVGFEIFDNRVMGATEFEQQLNFRRALQGELSRTINSLDEIQQSRVHIALPRDSLFIGQQKKATASVTVRLKQGKRLRQAQIDGIGRLVASSVEGMNPEDVTIVDSQGNVLSRNSGDMGMGDLSATQMEYQRHIERDLADQIRSMLENVVGQGKAVVRVSADLDFQITEKTEEVYDPDSQVVRSTQRLMDRSGPVSANGGDANPDSRADLASPNAFINRNGVEKEKTDETINYEINRVVSKTVMPVGNVRKLSIAVLVDGIYSKNEQGIEVYQERPRSELASLEDLVRKSAGLSAQRGDQVAVTSMPFSKEEEMAQTLQERLVTFMPVIKYVIMLLALLLVFLFVVRPLLKAFAPPPPEPLITEEQLHADGSADDSGEPGVSVELSGGAQALAAGAGAFDGPNLFDMPNMSELDLARHLATTNSKKFAEIIRCWLK